MKDFFISYNSADKSWAEWIAWTLEEAAYSVVIQAWDFRPGGNFVLEMQKATQGTNRTLIVLSESYLKADYTQPEWAAAFVADPRGEERKLLPVRVGACSPDGMLKPMIYTDLVGLDASKAREVLLEALQERVKPAQAPPFPCAHAGPASSAERVMPRAVAYPKQPQAQAIQELIGSFITFYRHTPAINQRTLVRDRDTIYTGDSIRAEFKAPNDGFLAIILCDSLHSAYTLELFDKNGERQNPMPVKARSSYLLPSSSHGWAMDDNPGMEIFFVILTPEAIPNEIFSQMLKQMTEEKSRGVHGARELPLTDDERELLLMDTIAGFLANQTDMQIAKVRLAHETSPPED